MTTSARSENHENYTCRVLLKLILKATTPKQSKVTLWAFFFDNNPPDPQDSKTAFLSDFQTIGNQHFVNLSAAPACQRHSCGHRIPVAFLHWFGPEVAFWKSAVIINGWRLEAPKKTISFRKSKKIRENPGTLWIWGMRGYGEGGHAYCIFFLKSSPTAALNYSASFWTNYF